MERLDTVLKVDFIFGSMTSDYLIRSDFYSLFTPLVSSLIAHMFHFKRLFTVDLREEKMSLRREVILVFSCSLVSTGSYRRTNIELSSRSCF